MPLIVSRYNCSSDNDCSGSLVVASGSSDNSPSSTKMSRGGWSDSSLSDPESLVSFLVGWKALVGLSEVEGRSVFLEEAGGSVAAPTAGQSEDVAGRSAVWANGWSAGLINGSDLMTLAGGEWVGTTFTVLNVGSC